MEANWQDFTLLEWSFDCIRMGASGFSVIPPEEGGGLPPTSIDSEEQTDEDYDDSAREVNRKNVINLKPSSGKFDFNKITNTTKDMSTIKVYDKNNNLRNRIHIPVRAEITSNGDIKFTFE